MAKDKITEYDSTANNNTVCGDVNIAENSALPSDMNNFAREIMSHLKEGLGSGTPLYVDQTNNRVGIGTSSPVSDAKLTISSDNTESNIFLERSGSGRFDVAIANTNGSLVFKGGSDQTTVAGLTEFMKIDGDTGAVTKPLQPAFMVHPATTQSNLAITSNVTIVFGTERFDNNSDFTSNTFTAPVTGKYQFNANIRYDDADRDANYQQLVLATSNKIYPITYDLGPLGSDSNYWMFNINILADMDASDTAYLYFYQEAGSATVDIQGDSFFSGYLVC